MEVAKVLAILKRFWYMPVIIGLAFTNVLCHSDLKNVRLQLAVEQRAHTHDIERFKQAQETADQLAKQRAEAIIKEAKANAAQADSQYASLLSKYNANLVRYKANQSHSEPAYSYQLPAPQGGDGPSAGTKLPEGTALTITMEDAQTCAVNTARLLVVQQWATSLPK